MGNPPSPPTPLLHCGRGANLRQVYRVMMLSEVCITHIFCPPLNLWEKGVGGMRGKRAPASSINAPNYRDTPIAPPNRARSGRRAATDYRRARQVAGTMVADASARHARFAAQHDAPAADRHHRHTRRSPTNAQYCAPGAQAGSLRSRSAQLLPAWGWCDPRALNARLHAG